MVLLCILKQKSISQINTDSDLLNCREIRVEGKKSETNEYETEKKAENQQLWLRTFPLSPVGGSICLQLSYPRSMVAGGRLG